MSDPKPHEKSICANCGTEIEWASRRPEEGDHGPGECLRGDR